MTIIKNKKVYTILHSEKIHKLMTYDAFIKLMCSKNTLIFKNYGTYVFDDWNKYGFWENDLSEDDIKVITTLVNSKRKSKVYCRFYCTNSDIIITGTNYFDDSDNNSFIWKEYDNKGILYTFNGILVSKYDELNNYICVIKIEEDHEKNMEIMHIKVRDEEWFENNIIPVISEKINI